ncbi:unnamed protein product [Blepharisma stoltei]|uniref:FHA domain-containing protein n=1 Tax=Blepharisma stoltei TaxID=1481888 RepID=A0AAU9KFH5_9CILI|nr:unnamed protein product [Blepharisma stoltei]
MEKSDKEHLIREESKSPDLCINPLEKPPKCLSVSIIRTSIEQSAPQVFKVYSTGVLNSQRLPQDRTIRIGRQQVTEDGKRPNDITLPATDRAISRTHCMIDCNDFFNKEIPDTWIAFLMGYHPRLGKKSILQFLPQDLFRCILMFIKEQKSPYLIDLGSMCGTYIRVSNEEPINLEPGQNFLIGSDIIIEIDRVVSEPVPLSVNSEQTLEEYQNTFNDTDIVLDDIGPYIAIKVSRNPNDNEETMSPSTWKFAAEEKYKVFTIGRSQICDIQLPENTISRTQCRIVYDEGKWQLFDGLESKPTVNGTWFSVFRKIRNGRDHSAPCKLSNGSQIKVSDTVLQVDWEAYTNK